MTHKPYGIYEICIKRLLDIVISLVVIIAFSWLYLILAILVRVNLGSPVIFKQKRPGKNEEIFDLYKFKSMTDKKDAEGNLLPDSERLTKFGRILRGSSLDELPEMFNILKGDMSLIGPRPLLVNYLPYYTEEEKQRHSIRPGLTGLAQVSGRNLLGWDMRLAKDIEYVNHVSFAMDMKIIGMTIKAILIHDGVEVDTSQRETNFAVERQAKLDALNGK